MKPFEKNHLLHSNNALYGLPHEVKFCKKCVISNQRPSSVVETNSSIKNQRKPTIEFDDQGVCSACKFAEKKKGAGGTDMTQHAEIVTEISSNIFVV